MSAENKALFKQLSFALIGAGASFFIVRYLTKKYLN